MVRRSAGRGAAKARFIGELDLESEPFDLEGEIERLREIAR